jgi:NAD(P)-dependent dehydrogenase (short-subunit alcohol dehydrogenase family)
MSGALAGKAIVVTGATSGIGAALVERLVAAGARVGGIGRDPAKLAAAASRWGALFVPLEADLAVPEARARVAAATAEAFPHLDALVNNAAEVVYELPTALPIARWRELLEVNFLAGVELVQALVPRMSAGSHVVNVSSITARFAPNARFAPYAVTKVAVSSLTDALRLELDPAGIRVTLVLPGLVDTPIYDKVAGFEKTKKKISEQVPTWLSAGDVADAIVWALDRPPHVVVGEMVLLPRGQPR